MIRNSRFFIPSIFFVAFLAGCPSRPVRNSADRPLDMVSVKTLAQQLGLEVSHDLATDLLVLSGARGTIVFNPRLRGIVIGDAVHFRGHRVVISSGRVSVPSGFIAKCEQCFKPAKPKAPEDKPSARDFGQRVHVVIDPGHGGKDPGATGASGSYEKTVNLLTSNLLAAKLRARGIRVTMTRPDDTFVELNERAAIGNRARADVFVSIHADYAHNSFVRGYTLFVVHTKYSDSSRAVLVADEYNLDLNRHNGGYAASRARRLEIIRSILASSRARSKHLASLIRLQLRKATGSPDRGTQLGAFRVLRRSVCPAVLVELGFMSNRSEERQLLRPDYQDRLAAGIAKGIILFLEGR